MTPARSQPIDPTESDALHALERAAATARAGFACMFSTSDEYETALISERRAQGRYQRPSRLPWLALAGFFAAMAAIVLLFA